MRPTVRVPLDVASNLVIAARGLAGDVDDAERQLFNCYLFQFIGNHKKHLLESVVVFG